MSEQHVVVGHPVVDQQWPLQRGRVREHRGLFIHLAGSIRLAQVALGVVRVVQTPIGDRGTGGGGLEVLGLLEDAHQAHVPSVATAVDGDFVGVDPGQGAQVLHTLDLVGHLDLSHSVIDRVLESFAARGRAPVVQGEDGVALLRHVLAGGRRDANQSTTPTPGSRWSCQPVPTRARIANIRFEPRPSKKLAPSGCASFGPDP